MARLFPPGYTFFKGGNVLDSGTVTFYETGTTTKKNTYPTSTLSGDANANPIDLNGSGQLPVDVHGSGEYTVLIQNVDGATVETRNNVTGAGWETIVTPSAYGCEGDGSTDDTTNLRAAITACVTNGWILNLEDKDYFLSDTIAPAGQFFWLSNGATLTFDADASGYTEVLDKGGAGSGVKVALDMEDSSNSRVVGSLTLSTDASVSDMKLASQANIPTTLAAVSSRSVGATNGDGFESQFDELHITKFGYGLFQSSQAGAGTSNTPFTRWRVSHLLFRFCKNPLWAGDNGNAFNDIWVDVLRVSRCSGQLRVKGTDFNCGSMFFFGFTEGTDNETATYTSSAGSASVTTSVDISASLTSGDTIYLGDDGSTNWPDDNLNSDGIHFGTILSSVTTTTMTVQTNVTNAVTAGKLYVNPARLFVGAGAFNCRHLYCEGIGPTVTGQNESVITIGELKIGGTSFAGINGAPIVYGGHQGTIDVTLKQTATESDQAKAMVVLGLVERDSDSANASRFVRVKAIMPKSEAELYSRMIDYRAIPAAFIDGSHSQVTGQTMLDNAVAQCGDGDHWLVGSSANGVQYTQGVTGFGGGNRIAVDGATFFASEVGSDTIANSGTADILSASEVQDNSFYLVTTAPTDKSAYVTAIIGVTGGGAISVINTIGSNGASLANNSGALQLTNSSGGELTFTTRALKIA